MKSKVFILFMVGTVCLSLLGNKTTSAKEDLQIYLNGSKTDSSIMIVKNTVFVPIEYINSNPKLTFGYIEGENPKLIILESNDFTVYLTIGSKDAKKNDENIKVTTPPFTKNDHKWIPLRFVAETFGLKVNWDPNTKNVSIQTPSKSK
ncbi:copper amine oxidase N-terminal domain-containing protein [Cohnella terricola]|uniref:Copper amine oxidase N-terminal domain-containing protein n=1 Tax=Cohnella terricola TaxID=1289167 RepID=A0A559J8Y8_9BACL|nr:copper amine oxidase N-terminal domain-containing protein [Cohnella terricola]TVX96306.1 copper amine oxidase N-terminal domain-containing protein [Cohnella terricola]